MRRLLAALGLVMAVVALIVVLLQALARRAEATGDVHPYKREDWLRYLVPTLWEDDGRPFLLLAGPSAARKGFYWTDVAAAFPDYRVLQGTLSGGTLGDVMASLEYVERTYGSEALPDLLVLGVSPRFMSEVPERRAFAIGLERYSPHLRVPGVAPTGFGLASKPAIEGTFDHVRFLATKQSSRYRAAAAWAVSEMVGPEESAWLATSPLTRHLFQGRVARRLWPERLMELGVHDYAIALTVPHQPTKPIPVDELTAMLDDPTSWWRDVYHWDPRADGGAVRARTEALLDFIARHGIELYVVNLPDRELSRRRYAPGRTEAYQALIRSVFATVPLLDVRCLLADDQFMDAEHMLDPGARRVTAHMLGFVKDVRRARAAAPNAPIRPGELHESRWAASCPAADVR